MLIFGSDLFSRRPLESRDVIEADDETTLLAHQLSRADENRRGHIRLDTLVVGQINAPRPQSCACCKMAVLPWEASVPTVPCTAAHLANIPHRGM
ncbi:hypothetical protein [Bradyrhizobium oligotrophicum]|uniref:hypothetical protein n=1 Tax=Bradyrhizobium oligotrophicum TaxID=44255 RepID=UPI003EB69EC4